MKKMKSKNKIAIILIIILTILLQINLSSVSYATNQEEETKIVLTQSNITVNGEEISTDTASNVYKSINIETNDDVKEKIENTVINIKTAGTYRISGTITNTQIAISAAETDEVKIILDNTNITCSTAPAIIVYSALDNKTAGDAGVTINLEKESNNIINGSHIPKNATYTQNGQTKSYSQKFDGAISSAVSLKIEGEGTLKVESDKEGIETKMHLTVNGGNIQINSSDDAINASEDNVSVITINDGTIYANIKAEAQEGDGIDSNGYIYINGGKIYAFASATSQDSGLDSDLGIYINGGTVIATGNMVDEISSQSSQKYIFLQFTNQIQAGTLVCVTDKEDLPIMAYKTDKNYTTFLYSSSSLNVDSYNVYTEGTIEGTKTNGLYTQITSYTKGNTASYTVADKSSGRMGSKMGDEILEIQPSSDFTIYIGMGLLILGIVLTITIIVYLDKKK